MITPDEAGISVRRVQAWIATGVRYDVEFKGELRSPLNDRELVEAVVCLANGSGGVLLVSVEADGTPTGARPRHEGGRTDLLRLQALIANNTQPPVATTVGVVDLDGASVIVVEVPDSPRVVGTARGTYVRRAISGDGRPMCIPYHAHEMLAHEVDRGAVDYASLPIHGARWEDLDPLEFERVRRLSPTRSFGWPRRCSAASEREIGRRSCNLAFSESRFPRTLRPHSGKRSPTH